MDRAREETGLIRDSIDLRVLAERLGLEIDRSGKALCVWHEERTPSMHVGTERHAVHCFGCGKSGDCFDLVMQVRQTDFAGAKDFLRETLGPGFQAPAAPLVRRVRKPAALPELQPMEPSLHHRWRQGVKGLQQDRDAQAVLAAWRHLPIEAFYPHLRRGLLSLERGRPKEEAKLDPPKNKYDLAHWQWGTLVECPRPNGEILALGSHRRVLEYKELRPLTPEEEVQHAWKADWFYSKGGVALPFWAGERDLTKVRSISVIEGQWDAIALDHHLREQGVEGALVLGLRGASSPARIEQFWLPLLQADLPIVVWPDNDKAGHGLFVDGDEPSFVSRLHAAGRPATVVLSDAKDFNELCRGQDNALPGLGEFYQALCGGGEPILPWFRVNPKKIEDPAALGQAAGSIEQRPAEANQRPLAEAAVEQPSVALPRPERDVFRPAIRLGGGIRL